MESLMLFLHIVAWAVAVLGTLLGGLSMYKYLTYEGSMEELQDKLRGQRAVYNPWKFWVPAFFAWAFIIAF